jgi:acyl transferase domain-containing protein
MYRVAIVGIGCRFPRAESPDGFWRLLRSGVDAVTDTPAWRWDVSAFEDSGLAAACGKGGFVDGVDAFDAAFFVISPREARQMDPQQRLLL